MLTPREISEAYPDSMFEEEALFEYKQGSYPQMHPDHYAFIHGYTTGAKPRQARIDELENQIIKIRKLLGQLLEYLPPSCANFRPEAQTEKTLIKKAEDFVEGQYL